MKVAIIDDEISEQNILEKYILEWSLQKDQIMDISKFDNSESFLFAWEDEQIYDLLILDIEMGKMNGLDLAKRIRLDDENIPIMFVTGYDEYVHDGYDVSALHYLIKPLNKTKLFLVLNKLQEKSDSLDKIPISTYDGMRSIPINKILYAEANGHQSILHLQDETIVMKESFGNFEKLIVHHTGFVKCHRAYMVNLKFVAMILKTDILLDNKEKIPVSRNVVRKVQDAFLQYYKKM